MPAGLQLQLFYKYQTDNGVNALIVLALNTSYRLSGQFEVSLSGNVSSYQLAANFSSYKLDSGQEAGFVRNVGIIAGPCPSAGERVPRFHFLVTHLISHLLFCLFCHHSGDLSWVLLSAETMLNISCNFDDFNACGFVDKSSAVQRWATVGAVSKNYPLLSQGTFMHLIVCIYKWFSVCTVVIWLTLAAYASQCMT